MYPNVKLKRFSAGPLENYGVLHDTEELIRFKNGEITPLGIKVSEVSIGNDGSVWIIDLEEQQYKGFSIH